MRQSRLGRLRGRSTHVLAAQKKKSKDAPPPEPNFLFFPVKKGSSGGSKSVPAEPMIKLLRLLHTITGSLNAVVKKEKVKHVFCRFVMFAHAGGATDDFFWLVLAIVFLCSCY